MDEDETNILNLILSEFPHKKKEITALYYQSSSFIELCEDYVLCKIAVKKNETDQIGQNNQKLSDLKLALAELYDELLASI